MKDTACLRAPEMLCRTMAHGATRHRSLSENMGRRNVQVCSSDRWGAQMRRGILSAYTPPLLSQKPDREMGEPDVWRTHCLPWHVLLSQAGHSAAPPCAQRKGKGMQRGVCLTLLLSYWKHLKQIIVSKTTFYSVDEMLLVNRRRLLKWSQRGTFDAFYFKTNCIANIKRQKWYNYCYKKKNSLSKNTKGPDDPSISKQ